VSPRLLRSASVFLFFLLSLSLLSAKDSGFFRKQADAVADGDEPEFSRAVEYIRNNRPPEVIPCLKDEYFDDDDRELRLRVISVLSTYPLSENSDTWTMMLRESEDPAVEIEIIGLLGTADNNPFIIPIAEKLLVPRAEVRRKAADTLKNIGDDKMFTVILSLAYSDTPVNRIYFIEALSSLYDQRFLKTVLKFLEDENKSVRIYTLECVLKNEIREALPLIRSMVKKDDNTEVRIRALRLMVFFNDKSSGGIVIPLLECGERELRLEALIALRELKISYSAGRISEMLLTEKDDEIKTAALETLAEFRSSGELRGIQHILKNDPTPSLRVLAAYVLGRMNDNARAADILESCLNDKDYRVRGEICSSLGGFKRGKTSEILLCQIETESSRYVKTSALYSLVQINDPRNIIRLFDIFTREKDMVFRMLLHDVIRAGLVKNIR